MILRILCLVSLLFPFAGTAQTVTLVPPDDGPPATIVLPDDSSKLVEYAALELMNHVAKATGRNLALVKESQAPATGSRIFLGPTRAAAAAGIDVSALPSEAVVLRTAAEQLFIAAAQGPGDPLSRGTSEAGTLWGVYEILERELGVRWLWPGELGTVTPRRGSITIGPLDETVLPRYQQRQLRPSLGLKGFTEGDERLGFSEAQREKYATDQSVFLRRHRMGQSANTYFANRKFGSGHAFHGWWEKYGAEHPEWFQMNPDGTRGPGDPEKPRKVSMCVSNPELAKQVVALWAEERAKHPGEPLSLGVGESDGSAMCVCEACKAWDDPMPDVSTLPAGLERSFEPVQAGARYARFAERVRELAAEIDPDVQVHFYAYLNYFWAPKNLTLNKNVMIGFVPWFRWAGWFPRTDAEQQWIKDQWTGWQKTGVTAYYRPNWFLDGYTMPLVYMHQFVDAFQFYNKNGMVATDFDSLQGMWAAQGPNLYALARIHVRPEMPVDALLDEYYLAFGPAADAVRQYFQFWENYAVQNSPRAAEAIRSRRDGMFRRYAHYAEVADELYPLTVFPSGFGMLGLAEQACNGESNPVYLERVQFLRAGLEHARKCVETAAIMNNPASTAAERGAALMALATYRRSVESLGIANMDRAAIIETDSWDELPGFVGLWEP